MTTRPKTAALTLTPALIPTLAVALLLGLAAAAAPPAAWAGRGDDAKRASKNGETAGEVGGVQVTLEYGRPRVKGRTLWGGLVPYGKVWRTGADEATTITFDRDVTVQGEPLAAGTYGLFTIPREDGWTVIFNREADQWGAFEYDPGEDALRVEVKPAEGEAVEEMDFVLDGDRVVLRWGTMRVAFTVEAAG